MKSLNFKLALPLAFLAAASFAQGDNRAVPRGSGGGSSDAGSRHTGGGSSGGSSSSNSDRSYGSPSSGDQSSAPDAARRRPRPGTGTGDRDRYGNDRGSYRGYPYSYYYYDPYFYGWGYRPYRYGYGYWDYGYSYGDYYGYYPSYGYRSYRYRSGNVAQLRTLVEPAKARVYVDGYYAGIADDFDGLLQRLNVSPGRHEITFKLEGYKSHTFSVYAGRDQTVKLRWDMEKGSGETRDSIGDEREDRDRAREDRYAEEEDARDIEARESRDRSREVDADDRRETPRPGGERVGEVLFEIEPQDASVYIDGEFHGKAGQLERVVLSLGRHRVEVVRPGYKTEETELEIGTELKKVVVRLDRR